MKTLYVIALIITCGISLAAQEKILTEAEFTEAASKAEKALYSGAHGPVRQLLETEVLTESRPETDYRLKSVTLIVPRKGNHRIEDRSFGGKPTKTESITVDSRNFIRNADGSWKELSAEPSSPMRAPEKAAPAPPQVLEQEAVFKYIGVQTIGDRKVHVYTKSEKRKSVNASGSVMDSDLLTKLFIGIDGTYFKHDSFTKNSFGGKGGHVKVVIELQADPAIKLIAPEVAK